MYWLYKDPKGKNIFNQISTTTTNSQPTKTGVSTIEQLQREVKQLQTKIKVGGGVATFEMISILVYTKELECEKNGTLIINPGTEDSSNQWGCNVSTMQP